MNRSNTRQSLSKSASRFKRRSVRQSTTRFRCDTTVKQAQYSCCQILLPTVKQNEKNCCQLLNKLKIIVAKYCIQLSNTLKIMQLSARTTCATRCTTTSAKQSTTPYRCKTDHRNQIFAKNLFCKSFILQTYIAGGEMRVQIWHKVWNPIRHRIRRGKKNTFLYPVFSWPTPHPKVCRTETRTEFKTEYDDKWALIFFFLASECDLHIQVWDKVRE